MTVNDSDAKCQTPSWTPEWMEASELIARLLAEASDAQTLAWCKYEDGNFRLAARELRRAANVAYEYADALAKAAAILEG